MAAAAAATATVNETSSRRGAPCRGSNLRRFRRNTGEAAARMWLVQGTRMPYEGVGRSRGRKEAARGGSGSCPRICATALALRSQ